MTPERLREIADAIQPGPCIVCGAHNYRLSFGGPTICPACDCGRTCNKCLREVAPLRELKSAYARIAELEARLASVTAVLRAVP